MSWRYYETLTTPPDFTDPPVQGLADERDTVDFANARSFIAWQDRTDRIFTFDFQTFAPEEWRILRDFFDRHAGRARSFYLPAWTQDFNLAADANAGADTIEVEGHALSDGLTENRPDTVGRRIMLVNHLGQSSFHWIEGAAAAGDRDVLVLDGPIPNPVEAGRTLISICYLSRLVDDTIQSEHISPTHARASLTFRQVSHRRYLAQTEVATGIDIATLNRNEDIIAKDWDPIYTDLTVSAALGPFFLGLPQTENFQTEWIADLHKTSNTVWLNGPGTEAPTDLYNAPGLANQIALTFDAASKAILAWEIDGLVTIARQGSPDIIRVSFPGYSPVAFNTFGIDSTVNAGTATIAVFYLKRQDPTIYCRIASENFLTERRYCQSPLAPIYLHAARRFDGRMEIVGMDANHRLARWRSQAYLTPPEIQIAMATIEPEITGDFRELRVYREDEEAATARIDGVAGEFRELRVIGTVPEEPMGTAKVEPAIGGSYSEIRVYSAAPEEPMGKAGIATTVQGSYTLIAIMTNAPEEQMGNAKIETTIGGSYG